MSTSREFATQHGWASSRHRLQQVTRVHQTTKPDNLLKSRFSLCLGKWYLHDCTTGALSRITHLSLVFHSFLRASFLCLSRSNTFTSELIRHEPLVLINLVSNLHWTLYGAKSQAGDIFLNRFKCSGGVTTAMRREDTRTANKLQTIFKDSQDVILACGQARYEIVWEN